MEKYAILLDGGFVIQKLKSKLRRFPRKDDVVTLCNKIRNNDSLSNKNLLRIYFYHATPFADSVRNPIDESESDFATTTVYRNNKSLLDSLELESDFALRLGETSQAGWKLGHAALQNIIESPRSLVAHDLVPDIKQKGVDLRIGLDIARLSLKQYVDTIVVVTGDSDFIPAFKFARREGIRVYLAHLDHGVTRDLKAHTDSILNVST